MATTVCLNPHELALLRGLPWLCFVLYVAIRERMDGLTGIVETSWAVLRQDCSVESGQNRRRSGWPSLQITRVSARQLSRRGLLVSLSKRERRAELRRLKFYCPIALGDYSAQNKLNRPSEQTFSEGKAQELNRPSEQSSMGLVLYQRPPTHSIERALESKQGGGGLLPENEKRNGNGNGNGHVNGHTIRLDGLTPEEQAEALHIFGVTGLTLERAQYLADELTGQIRYGKPIASRIAYLAGMIRNSKKNGWQATYAARVAAERSREVAQAVEAPETRHGPPSKPETVKAAISQMRTMVGKGRLH